MTLDQAMEMVAQQCNMLARIHEEQTKAMRPINEKLRKKIKNNEPLDDLEYVYAQINGLI